jgi:hypothetical protein
MGHCNADASHQGERCRAQVAMKLTDTEYADIVKAAITRCRRQAYIGAQLLDDDMQIAGMLCTIAVDMIEGSIAASTTDGSDPNKALAMVLKSVVEDVFANSRRRTARDEMS